MKIDNEFTVSVPVDEAWKVLTDLEGIAPCMPGARLTGVDGDVYSGKVKIKVGPVVSEYAGTARFVEKDDAAYRAVIDAKGKDSRGAGNAAATIHASLRPDGAHTVVTVSTDMAISGKIAQFGSGMIKEVSTKLLGQFVQNLEAKLLIPAEPVAPEESAAPAQPVPLAEEATSAGATPVSTVTTASSAPDAPPVVAAPVNGVSADIASASAASPMVAPTAATPAVPEANRFNDSEPEPLDLMGLAGGSIYKRVVPLVVAAVVVVAVIVYVVAR
jgi:carbon monoxide dehydrogenase subunit G